MIPNFLIAASAVTVGTLGLIHLILTFRGSKLRPRDPQLVAAMASVPLVITPQTTVWRAWLGFNASHSLGAMLFALVYGYLAIAHGEILFGSVFLQTLGLLFLVSFVLLAKLYWFITPLLGTSLATLCFLAGIVLAS